jgi:hypothetical protein
MANKFVTFLEHVGTDIEHGVEKALVYIKPLQPLIDFGLKALVPEGGLIAPVFDRVVMAAVLAQQAYQAPGSGPKRAATIISILGPEIESALPTKGADAVKKYVDAVVALLNLSPAPTA